MAGTGSSSGSTRLAFEFNFGLWYVIFEEMLLKVGVDPCSQNEERFHVIAVLHDLFTVLDISPHLLAMDVISTRQLTSLLSLRQHCPDLSERIELDLWRAMT